MLLPVWSRQQEEKLVKDTHSDYTRSWALHCMPDIDDTYQENCLLMLQHLQCLLLNSIFQERIVNVALITISIESISVVLIQLSILPEAVGEIWVC